MTVLVHGLGVGARYFRPLAAELGPEARVPELHEPLPIAELALRLADTLDGPAVVVANSMGCQVAVELAVRRPELVESLVLVGPTVDPRAHSILRHVGRLLVDAWYEPPSVTGIVVRDYFSMGPLDVLRQARLALEHRIEEVLPLVEQPAVVVRGSYDPLCPADWARDAASLLPHGRFVTIAGAAHAAHYSHPREVARLVKELAGAPAAAHSE